MGGIRPRPRYPVWRPPTTLAAGEDPRYSLPQADHKQVRAIQRRGVHVRRHLEQFSEGETRSSVRINLNVGGKKSTNVTRIIH
ncbi:hypothetical protein E2C01_000716 [Portunus trituberculatus]|uniref:Uncharacterized protein n=1 Tax=Portunus trituberculatus TaxID=210409 RepID=A0A5B7CFU5_PORTR|nr:hypothetical protein [Portunus trituberculatus]